MDDSVLPDGICMTENFIDSQREAEILQILRHEIQWPDRTGRRSIHYGYTFCYKTFGIDKDVPFIPFPSWLKLLLPQTETRPPDQVCIQHYPPGTGIPPHVDTHSAFDQLYALSLGSPIVMRFQNKAKGVAGDIDLVPRSMMQMRGDARLHWTHAIRARKTDVLPDATTRPRGDRWSITYRWLRDSGECECGNNLLCDTAQRRTGLFMRELRWKKAEELANSLPTQDNGPSSTVDNGTRMEG